MIDVGLPPSGRGRWKRVGSHRRAAVRGRNGVAAPGLRGEGKERRIVHEDEPQHLEPDRDLTVRLCSLALSGGFAVCGVAERRALAAVPPRADPDRILPGYRSVLVVGASPDQVVSSGPYGPAMLVARPAETLSHIRRELESVGYRVRPVAEGGASLPRLAQAADLGDLGPVHMLVVPRHGLGLTLFGLVSDAPLARLTGTGVSESSQCDDCGLCTEDCPAMLPGSFDRNWCVGCGGCVAVCPQAR